MVVDSVIHFPLLAINEGISLFLLFIDIIDVMPFQVFLMVFLIFNIFLEIRGEVCLLRTPKKS